MVACNFVELIFTTISWEFPFYNYTGGVIVSSGRWRSSALPPLMPSMALTEYFPEQSLGAGLYDGSECQEFPRGITSLWTQFGSVWLASTREAWMWGLRCLSYYIGAKHALFVAECAICACRGAVCGCIVAELLRVVNLAHYHARTLYAAGFIDFLVLS